MSLEKIAGTTKKFFSHWTGVGLLMLTGAGISIPVTDSLLIEPSDNRNIAQEQTFLDDFHQNMDEITVLRKSMVIADKTKELDELSNGEWDTSSKKWGDYTLTKLRGAEQLEQKTDDMIVDILTDTELPEKTFYKIGQEMKSEELQTYNIDMSGASSWYLREAQIDTFGDSQASSMTKFEKAQEIREDVASEERWDMIGFLGLFLLYVSEGRKLSSGLSRLAGKTEEKLKNKKAKKPRLEN